MLDTAITTIAVEDIEVHAYHGVYPNERLHGNLYRVSVYVDIPTPVAVETDQLGDTVDYFQLYKLVLELMEQPVNLLEHLCWTIGQRILKMVPQLIEAKVKLNKVRPHAMEQCAQTFVEMRFRPDRKQLDRAGTI